MNSVSLSSSFSLLRFCKVFYQKYINAYHFIKLAKQDCVKKRCTFKSQVSPIASPPRESYHILKVSGNSSYRSDNKQNLCKSCAERLARKSYLALVPLNLPGRTRLGQNSPTVYFLHLQSFVLHRHQAEWKGWNPRLLFPELHVSLQAYRRLDCIFHWIWHEIEYNSNYKKINHGWSSWGKEGVEDTKACLDGELLLHHSYSLAYGIDTVKKKKRNQVSSIQLMSWFNHGDIGS